jgi:hypothetical protein
MEYIEYMKYIILREVVRQLLIPLEKRQVNRLIDHPVVSFQGKGVVIDGGAAKVAIYQALAEVLGGLGGRTPRIQPFQVANYDLHISFDGRVAETVILEALFVLLYGWLNAGPLS